MRRHRRFKQGIIGLAAAALVPLCFSKIPGSMFGTYISDSLQGQILKLYLPSFSYILKEEAGDTLFMDYVFAGNVPILKYIKAQASYETEIEDADTYRRILEQEANDEEKEDVLWEALLNENASALLQTENQTAPVLSENAIREEMVNLEDLMDYDTLVKEFYAIDKSTAVNAEKLNLEKLLEKDVSLHAEEGTERGSILIYHTHSQEGYVNSIPGDLSTTVVGVGEKLAEYLRACGYTVIHDTGVYDLEDRNYAYAQAGEALEEMLLLHPEIEVIIDLHRDGVSDEKRLVTEIDGKKMAQFMFFNGLSYTTTLGDIDYLPNDYIDDNLSFAFQLQLKAREFYPGLARKIYLKGYRYNLHYRPKSLLIEVGAQTNTLEEALASMEPLSRILDMVLTPSE